MKGWREPCRPANCPAIAVESHLQLLTDAEGPCRPGAPAANYRFASETPAPNRADALGAVAPAPAPPSRPPPLPLPHTRSHSHTFTHPHPLPWQGLAPCRRAEARGWRAGRLGGGGLTGDGKGVGGSCWARRIQLRRRLARSCTRDRRSCSRIRLGVQVRQRSAGGGCRVRLLLPVTTDEMESEPSSLIV